MKSSPRVPSWLRLVSGLLLAPALPAALTAQSAPQDNWTLDRVVKVSRVGDGLFSFPIAVRVLSDGTVAVADRSNHRIQIFDQSGKPVRSIGSYGTADGQLSSPYGIVELKDGNIAVAETGENRIKVFSKSGVFVRKWGENGSANGQFQFPAGLEVLPDGMVLVCDMYNNRVQVFEPNGTYVRHWQTGGNPTSLALTQDNRIAVACTDSNIRVYNPDGSLVRQFGSWGTSDGQFRFCIGVATLSDGKIAVSDRDNNRVQVFFPDGTFVRKWGVAGSKDGELNSPHLASITGDGKMFVADAGNNRVQIFTEQGSYVGQFGAPGDGSENLGDVRWVDADSQGNLIVLSRGGGKPDVTLVDPSGSIKKRFRSMDSGWSYSFRSLSGQYFFGYNSHFDVFSADGAFEFRVGSPGSASSGNGLFGNSGVIPVVAADGAIFAADIGNSRVQKFSSSGVFITAFGEAGTGPGQLSNLRFIGCAPDGAVVVRTGNSTQRFTPAGALIDSVGGGIWDEPGAIVFAADGVNFHGWRLYSYASGSFPMVSVDNNGNIRGFSREMGGFFRVDGVSIQVWRRGFRTLGTNPPKSVPMPGILTTKQRTNGYVDIEYTVTDPDSPTVTTALLAYRAGSALVKDIVPLKPDSLVESSSTKVGANVPTGVVHRVTWNPANSGLYSGDLAFEILARDDRPKLLDIDYITLPTTPALTISRSPLLNSDFNTIWAWFLATGEAALTRAGDGEIVGPGGVFTYTSGSETKTNFPGRAWLLAKLGVREATADEVQKAKLATSTSGSPNRFTPSASQRMGARPQSLNEWTFDSADYGSEAWWVVPLQ